MDLLSSESLSDMARKRRRNSKGMVPENLEGKVRKVPITDVQRTRPIKKIYYIHKSPTDNGFKFVMINLCRDSL